MDRVIIYGTGKAFKKLFSGDDIVEWMKNNNISIAGVANTEPDKLLDRHVNISDSTYEISHISDFPADSYDYILVTTPLYFGEIKEYLVSLGISEDIVIYIKDFIDKTINDTSKCKYGISIAAIVKDEADYIEEWIQFHILMGIEHFYIYDNESSDGTTEILKEYEKLGLVTYIFWPGKYQQIPAYSNAIERFKNDSIYIAFIDVDEFLFSVAGNRIIDEVNQILDQYKNSKRQDEKIAAAIGVNWRVYGTSFYLKKSNDLVIKRFVLRRRAARDINIKSIHNPRAVTGMSMHNAKFVPGYCCISENGSEIPGAHFRDGRCQRLRINHYMSKSEEEYIKRKRKGDAWNEKSVKNEEDIKRALRAHRTSGNERYDPILVQYSDSVEKSIEAMKKSLELMKKTAQKQQREQI